MLNSGNQFVLYIRVLAGSHEMFQACHVHMVLVINTYVHVQATAEKKEIKPAVGLVFGYEQAACQETCHGCMPGRNKSMPYPTPIY
jgi:hypothetical protein